jgi:ParB-like chromosome segregation protein Spo0J
VTFGFAIPILATTEGDISYKHGRIEAAKALGLADVPVIFADHHCSCPRLRIADNKLAELSDWK